MGLINQKRLMKYLKHKCTKKYRYKRTILLLRRCYVSVVLMDGSIYAMGGSDGHQRLRSAEKYDFERNQWTIIAPMNFQRSDACSSVLNSVYKLLWNSFPALNFYSLTFRLTNSYFIVN